MRRSRGRSLHGRRRELAHLQPGRRRRSGSATVASNGDWTYSPTADYHGPDSSTFRANDGSVNSNTATMSITVTPVNDAPVCADDSSGGVKNQVQTGTLACTDVDGDSLTYTKVAGPSHGMATVASNGDWSYTPTTTTAAPTASPSRPMTAPWTRTPRRCRLR